MGPDVTFYKKNVMFLAEKKNGRFLCRQQGTGRSSDF